MAEEGLYLRALGIGAPKILGLRFRAEGLGFRVLHIFRVELHMNAAMPLTSKSLEVCLDGVKSYDPPEVDRIWGSGFGHSPP